MALTDRLRVALARVPEPAARAELAGLVRLAGAVVLRGGPAGGLHLRLSSRVGAVARRGFAQALGGLGVRGELMVDEPRGVEPRRWVVHWAGPDAVVVGSVARLVDLDGRIRAAPPTPFAAHVPAVAVALLRGALLARGSLATAGGDRLEIGVGRAADLVGLVGLVAGLGVPARSDDREGGRLRWHGAAVADVLDLVGADALAAERRELGERRRARRDTVRQTNADSANVTRSVAAAARQHREVRAALDVIPADDLPAHLRAVALARLANPSLSLAEVGELLDPPRSRAAVLRRLQRLRALAETHRAADGSHPSGLPGRG